MKFLDLKSQLLVKEASGLLRDRVTLNSAQGTEVKIASESYVNFASNDYLGLANSSQSVEAAQSALKEFGFGSGASHLIVGHQSPHHDLELKFAEFLQRDSALAFSSGYMANLGVLQALTSKGDLILADKLNHASLIDGARLSQADSLRYPHCDLKALEKRLSRSSQNTFVVTDSVFSMDGDIAPLDEIAALCEKHNAILIVDDAHGFGVIGKNGRGAAELFDLDQNRLPVLITTLGKALGGYGAIVSGKNELVDYLMQSARNYIYTTSLPASVASGNLANLDIISGSNELIKALTNNTNYFKALCEKSEIKLVPSDTAIQPLLIGENEKLIAVNNRLEKKGILVGAIRPPTVPKNSARLRITITAKHSKTQIEKLVSGLKEAL